MQRLGGGYRVSAEGDGGRADQVVDDASAAAALGGEAGQRVLGDDVVHSEWSQPTAQILQLGHAEPAVLGEYGDLSAAETSGKVVDGRILFGPSFYATFGHRAPFLTFTRSRVLAFMKKPPTWGGTEVTHRNARTRERVNGRRLGRSLVGQPALRLPTHGSDRRSSAMQLV